MLQIARILKSNGIDGGLLLSLRDILAEQIQLTEPVFIIFDGLPVPFFIRDIRSKGSFKAVVHLNDVTSLEDAEEMVGKDVFVESSIEEEEEEDFTGWKVYDRGRLIGEVTGMEPIPGNLCLYIGEIMIPLHEDFIIEADPQSRTMNLDLPQGLF